MPLCHLPLLATATADFLFGAELWLYLPQVPIRSTLPQVPISSHRGLLAVYVVLTDPDAVMASLQEDTI